MSGYAWGQATTDVNAGTIKALAEGATWVKMYCPDTNINYTADAAVHFLEEGKEYYVRNRDSGMQLGVNNQNTPGVSFVWQEDEDFIPSQQFVFESVNKTTPYLYIKNVYSNLYLGVYDNSTEADQGLRLYNKDASADGQKFKITRTTDNYFKISPKTGEGADPDMVLAKSGALFNPNLIVQKNLENSSNHEWEVFTEFNAILLGLMDEDGNDRHTYFSGASDSLRGDYYIYREYSSWFTVNDIQNYLSNSKIFVMHTHGNQNVIKIGSSASADLYLYSNNMTTWNLTNLDLVLLLSCATGMGGYTPSNITNNTPVNIIERMVCQGAETVIGFDDVTVTIFNSTFGVEFIRLMLKEEYTAQMAITEMKTEFDHAWAYTAQHAVIAGNTGLTLP